MAGIIGIARAKEQERIRNALGTIAHRGEAGRSVRAAKDTTFGCVWPIAQELYAVENNRHHVALDGEIYNWPDLVVGATCPLEAIESAYHSTGPDFVAQLDGPFALAMAVPQGIFLARDLVGTSPLYYGRSEGQLCFASEIKALADWADHIEEFPPGHYYAPGQGLVQYARLGERPPVDLEPEEVATQLRNRLVASVQKRADREELGAWLSGGLDSATMTALARRQVPVLHTFAAGVEGSPDLAYARQVADFVGTNHHERRVTRNEMLAVLPDVIYHLESFDALLVRSSITNFLVGQVSSEHVPAVLSGEGGDELFAGYAYLKDLEPQAIPAELIDITGRLHNTALQRVDRCSASHGLVARTGFLDREVMDFAFRIPPEMKLHRNSKPVEKWILRVAMAGLLPDAVLNRTKAKFWEGAGVVDLLEQHAEEIISDTAFERERTLPRGDRLNTKEELFYYRLFREQFGENVDPALVGRTKGAPVTL